MRRDGRLCASVKEASHPPGRRLWEAAGKQPLATSLFHPNQFNSSNQSKQSLPLTLLEDNQHPILERRA